MNITGRQSRLSGGGGHALAKTGHRIPEDIAVLSFGNSLAAEITMPALSCIDLQDYALGAKSAEILLAEILGNSFEPVTVLDPYLIQREST